LSRAFVAVFLGALLVSGCATSPPRNPSNLCDIFREKDDWYSGVRASEARWDVPIPIQMAIIRHESAFVADARPPRTWFLFIPTGRVSSAYGYSQALDGTWERYLRMTGRWTASRDDFEDASDFVGWYVWQTSRELGIPTDDAYRQYLAYHEGPSGYAKGSYRQKTWLVDVAKNVARTARRYDGQLAGCRGEFDEDYARN
jgi:hypothetical protein